jgi:hypothetical protein
LALILLRTAPDGASKAIESSTSEWQDEEVGAAYIKNISFERPI